MQYTGDLVAFSGIYESDCKCQNEIALNRYARFPRCSRCGREVNWAILRTTRIKQEILDD